MVWEAIAGGAASLLGGILGGRSADEANRAAIEAARENREAQRREMLINRAGSLAAMLGPQRARRLLEGSLGGDEYRSLFRDSDTQARRQALLAELDQVRTGLAPYRSQASTRRRIGGLPGQDPAQAQRYDTGRAGRAGVDVDALRRREAEINALLRGAADNPDGIDSAAYDAMGPGVLGRYDEMTRGAEREGAEALAGFGRDTDLLMGQARGIEDAMQGYGDEERRRINRDTDRAITGSNRLIESRLLSRGLGASTTLTGALAGNVRGLEEGRASALGSLNDRIMQMRTGAMRDRLGLRSGRLGAATQMRLGNQDRVAGYRQQALGMETGLLTGGLNNPTSSLTINPGLSPTAAGQATWGNTLGAIGGTLLGSYLGGGLGGGGQGRTLEQMRADARAAGGIP